MAGNDNHFTLIPNAVDCVEDPETWEAVVGRVTKDLTQSGFEVTVLNLREYFGFPLALSEALEQCNRMFVTGGNVFVLRRAMA